MKLKTSNKLHANLLSRVCKEQIRKTTSTLYIIKLLSLSHSNDNIVNKIDAKIYIITEINFPCLF